MKTPAGNTYGKPPFLTWLATGDLYADSTYQRSMETRRSIKLIANIAADFKWSKFAAVLCCKTDRGYALLDGQHRIEAAKRIGIGKVPCVVIETLNLAEQAAAFVGANRDRVAINQFSMHHALLAAGDPFAEQLSKICAECGVSLPRYQIPAQYMKPGQTLAIGTIARIIKRHGPEVAQTVLRTAMGAYGTEAGKLSALLLRALEMVLTHRDSIERGDVEAFLIRVGSKGLERAVSEARALGIDSIQEAYAHVILSNVRRPSVQKPPASKTPTKAAKKFYLNKDGDETPEIAVQLESPMQRRCQGCGRVFVTKFVTEFKCVSCSGKSKAAE